MVVEGFAGIIHGKDLLTETPRTTCQLHSKSLCSVAFPTGPAITLNTCLGVPVCLEFY